MNNNPAQKRQQTVDRMRKKMLTNKGERKICLVMLIKDEQNDPNKLLNSFKSVINTISITNVKLADEIKNVQIDIIINWGKNNNVPVKINDEQFKNFGHNWTQAIKMAKLDFPDTDYFLLSSLDENWEVKSIDKTKLIENRYDVLQNYDGSYYSTTKLLSAKINWSCKLNTFSYWINADDKIGNLKNIKHNLLTDIKIDITSSNHYERDVKLLFDDLNNPALSRSDKLTVKFYLSKIFKDNDRFEDAIYYANERINGGGWEEEIYHSLYNIGLTYEKWGWKIKQCFGCKDEDFVTKWNIKNLNDTELLRESVSLFTQAITNYKKAYEYRPSRAESLYSLVKLCRMIKTDEMNMLAYQSALIGNKIILPNDKLFVRSECYSYLFDFEIAMIAYLIPGKKQEGAVKIADLLNRKDVPEEIKTQIRSTINNYI